jgi:hypothetical protein
LNANTKSQILFISGPSGAGKSAFIRQLRTKSLPSAIVANLPAEAADWSIIEANDITKGDLDEASVISRIQQGESLIVHYDIVFIHCRQKKPSYPADQAIAFLSHVEKIHSVFIRPEPDVLQKQFAARSAQILQRKSRGSRIWTSLIRTPMRQIRGLIKPKKTSTTQALYRLEGFIASCYQQWEKHLASMAASKPLASSIIIEPAVITTAVESFQIIAPKNPFSDS